MKLRWLVIIASLATVGGMAWTMDDRKTSPVGRFSAMPSLRTDLTLADFSFIFPSTTMDDVISKVGPPHGDLGSGLHVFHYVLKDGSHITFSVADLSEPIIVIGHGDRILKSGAVALPPT